MNNSKNSQPVPIMWNWCFSLGLDRTLQCVQEVWVFMLLQLAKFAIWISRSEHFFLTFPVSSGNWRIAASFKKNIWFSVQGTHANTARVARVWIVPCIVVEEVWVCICVCKWQEEPLDLPHSEQQQTFPTSPYQVKLVGQHWVGQNPSFKKNNLKIVVVPP